MMRGKTLALAFSLLAFSTVSAASGGYVSNYSDWKKLSPSQKQMYAAGLFDSYNMAGTGDDDLAVSFGLAQCAIDLKLTGDMLSEAITNYYSAHTDMWDKGPIFAFHNEIIRGACFRFVNDMRARYGLEPWVKQ